MIFNDRTKYSTQLTIIQWYPKSKQNSLFIESALNTQILWKLLSIIYYPTKRTDLPYESSIYGVHLVSLVWGSGQLNPHMDVNKSCTCRIHKIFVGKKNSQTPFSYFLLYLSKWKLKHVFWEIKRAKNMKKLQPQEEAKQQSP